MVFLTVCSAHRRAALVGLVVRSRLLPLLGLAWRWEDGSRRIRLSGKITRRLPCREYALHPIIEPSSPRMENHSCPGV